jgi:hypothetical protein
MSLWIPASDELFETMPAALQAAKQFGPARWKWHKTPGDGKRTAYLACNAHVDCPVVLKAHKEESSFQLAQRGQHSEQIKQYKRKNAALTQDQEEKLRFSVDTATRPGEFVVALTKQKLDKTALSKEDVVKSKTGGLEGEKPQNTVDLDKRCCILHVSCMYPACILHVSCMYLACILVPRH